MDADASDAAPGSPPGEPDPWSISTRAVPQTPARPLTTPQAQPPSAPAPSSQAPPPPPPPPAPSSQSPATPLSAPSRQEPATPPAPSGQAPPPPPPPPPPAPPGRPPAAADSETPGPGPADMAALARRRHLRWIVEWAVVLVVALLVALGVRAFVVQTFFIPSQSMEPTLMVGDRILVDKLSYHLHPVHRGDIIVFGRPPGEAATDGIQDLVKRVVGLPGETIWSTGENVYVQGPDTGGRVVEVPEPVPGTMLGPPIRHQTIPANDYFVMGDNRTNSDDSRFFGPISRSLIVGRVVMRIWPLSHVTFF